jgi:zinc protease
MDIRQKRLRNNLNTLFIHSPGSTSASVQIWFRAGSALEEKSERGIAHFLEHMFFKGTPKRPGAKIAHDVESFGGEINAFTSFDYTCYYINAPAKKIKSTVEILLDMVSNPKFSKEDLIPERDVVHEEYRRSIDNPSQYNFFEIQKNAFTKGYSHPILGTEKNIKNFSRSQLLSFRKRFYNTSNALLVVSGDIKKENELVKVIEGFKLPNGKETSFVDFKLKNKPTLTIHHQNVNQASITMCFKSAKYLTPESASEDLAINCLAFGDISPLYKNLITDSSIANAASGSTMFFNKGGIHFLKIMFPIESLNKALETFYDTVNECIQRGFSNSEVDRIRNQYIASKVYEKETIESFAFSLGHGFAQDGDIHCEEKFIDEIKKTTVEDISDSLQTIFNRNSHITVQLPKDVKDSNKIENQVKKFQDKLKQIGKNKKKSQSFSLEKSAYDPNVKVYTIAKGIKFVYRHNPMSPTFVFHSYIKGGLSHETKSNNGVYNLLAKLILQGHKNKDYDDLKLELETKSAYLNGYAGKNAYGITMHGLSEHFPTLIEDYFLSLISPTIPEHYLLLEKELIKRQLEIQKEDPVKQCFSQVNQLVFNKHPYAQEMTGSNETLSKLTKDKILNVHNDRLQNAEIVFTYCGNKSFEAILKEITPFVKDFKPRKENVQNDHPIKPLYNKEIEIEFEREQTHIFIGKASYKNGSKEDLYLKMITNYLSGQSSALFVDVRDKKGLCYAVQPLHHSALEAGYWGIYIGAGKDKVKLAIEAIFEIINDLRDNGLSNKEFNRIKKMIEGSNLLNIQTNDDYANFYSIPVLHGLGIDYQHKSYEKINKFKVEDFNKFLKKFFDKDWNIIKVGPKN